MPASAPNQAAEELRVAALSFNTDVSSMLGDRSAMVPSERGKNARSVTSARQRTEYPDRCLEQV